MRSMRLLGVVCFGVLFAAGCAVAEAGGPSEVVRPIDDPLSPAAIGTAAPKTETSNTNDDVDKDPADPEVIEAIEQWYAPCKIIGGCTSPLRR